MSPSSRHSTATTLPNLIDRRAQRVMAGPQGSCVLIFIASKFKPQLPNDRCLLLTEICFSGCANGIGAVACRLYRYCSGSGDLSLVFNLYIEGDVMTAGIETLIDHMLGFVQWA